MEALDSKENWIWAIKVWLCSDGWHMAELCVEKGVIMYKWRIWIKEILYIKIVRYGIVELLNKGTYNIGCPSLKCP